jgi:DNA-binding MarR family transcriptional regulator
MAQAKGTGPRDSAVDSVVQSLWRAIRSLKSAPVPGNPVDGACSTVLHFVEAHGPVRPSDLAAHMSLDGSTISRHLQALERLDLVQRERDPDDGRAFRIACTTAGTAAAAEAVAARRGLLLAALRNWPAADLEQLERLLGRLAEDLASTSADTRPSHRGTAAS